MAPGASTSAGDNDEVGQVAVGWGEGFGGEVVAGENGFLVKSNLAVALFAKRAIAKLAIAIFRKRATAIGM